jgi:hypothetical protein
MIYDFQLYRLIKSKLVTLNFDFHFAILQIKFFDIRICNPSSLKENLIELAKYLNVDFIVRKLFKH